MDGGDTLPGSGVDMLGDICNSNGELPALCTVTGGACLQRAFSSLWSFDKVRRACPVLPWHQAHLGSQRLPLPFGLGTHPAATVYPGSTFSEYARLLLTAQKKQEEEQKKKWAEEKKMRTYEGMFTDEAIDAYHAELSDDDFM